MNHYPTALTVDRRSSKSHYKSKTADKEPRGTAVSTARCSFKQTHNSPETAMKFSVSTLAV